MQIQEEEEKLMNDEHFEKLKIKIAKKKISLSNLRFSNQII